MPNGDPFNMQRKTGLNPLKSFGQKAFGSLGLGGTRQLQSIKQAGDVKKRATDISRLGAQSQVGQARRSAELARGETTRSIQEQQDEMLTAQRYADEDVRRYTQDVNKARYQFTQDIARKRDQIREQLAGTISDQDLETKLQGYTDLLSGIMQTVTFADEFGGGQGRTLTRRSARDINAPASIRPGSAVTADIQFSKALERERQALSEIAFPEVSNITPGRRLSGLSGYTDIHGIAKAPFETDIQFNKEFQLPEAKYPLSRKPGFALNTPAFGYKNINPELQGTMTPAYSQSYEYQTINNDIFNFGNWSF